MAFISQGVPALVLAPMDGITDAAMRDFMGSFGAFTYGVTEFVRVSEQALPAKVFRREVPELANGGRTASGLPVQVQILGGDAERMAASAATAVEAGASALDLNFGCPAPVVNRNDGGASLLRCPPRIREIVAAVRAAVPLSVPVSAKLRLGWDDVDTIHETAAMAVEGGASWLTIHARTRVQGYNPPVYWPQLALVREAVPVPVIANGDIWSLDDFWRCRDETGCIHFMIGRGALADPRLPLQISRALNLSPSIGGAFTRVGETQGSIDWLALTQAFAERCRTEDAKCPARTLQRLKQWLNLAHRFGDFAHFALLKRCETLEELFDVLRLNLRA